MENKIIRNIWFTSDTHYNNSNICYPISNWNDKEKSTRKFNSLEEMNNTIIDNINKCVKEDDILYHLGDWSFGGIDSIYEFRKQINCKNIHLIVGNHDEHIKNNKKLLNAPIRKIEGFQIYTNAQDLFLSVSLCLEITINKQFFVLSHYPFQEWCEMDRKESIHLHGHSHHKLDYDDNNIFYKRMDVGIDWEEFRPYSLEEILDVMKERKIKRHNL